MNVQMVKDSRVYWRRLQMKTSASQVTCENLKIIRRAVSKFLHIKWIVCLSLNIPEMPPPPPPLVITATVFAERTQTLLYHYTTLTLRLTSYINLGTCSHFIRASKSIFLFFERALEKNSPLLLKVWKRKI